MFDWIPAFFETTTAFVPRMVKVPPTERMIKWKNCGDITDAGSGLLWYWPMVTEVEIVDIRWRSTLNSAQTITMMDGTPVTARAMVVWRPKDFVQMIQDNQDYVDRVAELALSITVDVLGPLSKEQLQTVNVLNYALTAECRSQLADCGIEVQRAKFTELVVSPAFRLLTDAS